MTDEETTTETEAVSETSADTSTEETSATEADSTEGEKALGDAGKRALDAMKADRNAAKAEAKRLADELAAFKAKSEGKEAEYAAQQEAQRVKDEALDAANSRILKAEVRAAAAGQLADPQDALLHIDLSSFEVGDDGEVDASAITSAIQDLITRKPYLAVQDGKRFQGTADAGTRNESRPPQLTEQDVKRLASEGRHDEIVRAKAEGRLADLYGS